MTLHSLARVRLPTLPLSALLRWQILPLRQPDDSLSIACGAAPEQSLLAWLDGHLDESYRWEIADPEWIRQALEEEAENFRALSDIALDGEHETTPDGQGISLSSLADEENLVVRLVNSTLRDAVIDGASDIHFEALRDGLAIKFRIDGLLREAGEFRDALGRTRGEQIVSRIKVLAELDIAETRIPQDGRFKAQVGERQGEAIDFRVSVMPSLHGEDVVLRILDKRRLESGQGLSLARLGLFEEQAASLRSLAQRPHGMVLITGPTGSGKTTTLYALLLETAESTQKTVTIEDPVEYQLPGILQIPVNEKKGLTFARGLRSVLRHDPDRIMVGEIRDAETAEIAVQAALTGHLVLSSVHANGVFEVIQRFTHMGVDLHALGAGLNGIVAQRLVRRNCPHCLADDPVADAELPPAWQGRGLLPRRGRGCPACRGSGQEGRRAITQILVIDDDLREAIIARAPIRELKALAARQGSGSWDEAAWRLLAAGEISLTEARRALGY